MLKIGINGFGRIGRMALKRIIELDTDVEVVAINDLTDAVTLAHLVKFDSTFGTYENDVEAVDGAIVINGKQIPVSAQRNPAEIAWADSGVEVVLECTGVFRKREDAAEHLKAGAKAVIISAPGKGPVDATIVIGVNDDILTGKEEVISCASCTTNCLAPMAKVLDDVYGIKQGMMTTVHSYTSDQRLLDAPHSDLRRARSAAESIVPTTTGAAKAVGLVLPHLAGKLNGGAIRVPTPNGSLTILNALVERTPESINDIHRHFETASTGAMNGILAVENMPLVSRDYIGNSMSCTLDLESTMLDGNMVRLLGWYDNEWGYSCRLVDLAIMLGAKKQMMNEAKTPPKE